MAEQNAEKKIPVDEQTAFNMSVLEFDKLIAESEANTADLKKQKVTFIYDTNVNSIVAQHETKQPAEGGPEDLAPLNDPPEKEDSVLEKKKKAKEEPPLSDTSK